jgi:GNAT superfamily N-acetyltransferase
MTIRPARPADFPVLQAIERSAGELFVDVGMPEVAADDPASDTELAAYADGGRAWVLTDEGDAPVAYALVDVVDGCAHLEQLSVRRDHQRRGLGRRLLDHVAEWARARGLRAVTLTTFRAVPWNAPYYERLGFRPLAESELTPGLAEVLAHEAAAGLDPDRRVCMRRDLV